jgi:hypothetical protein
VVLVQAGYSVPYQLHCWAPLQAADELLEEVLTELVEVAIDEGAEVLLEVATDVATLVDVLLDVEVATLELDGVPPQIAPVIVGVSMAPPLAST